MSKTIIDNGPWRHGETQDGRMLLESDDFTHDVRLYVDGDFADDDDKGRYAKGIENKLNAPVSAEHDGLTAKQAWWAGCRAGKGLPADTPRHEAIAAPVDAQPSELAIPPEKPLPDLMMASYHEVIGWNECRKAMISAQALPDPRTPADMLVNGGALNLALNALRRAGKNEIADELVKTATPAQQPVSGADGLPIERVLIDGTAYELPSAVAAELLRLHLEILGAEQELAALAQQDADKGDVWQCTTTLQESDDLIWLYCQDTNTIDGPVKPNPEFIDAWTHWAWVTHPSTTAIDADRKEPDQ